MPSTKMQARRAVLDGLGNGRVYLTTGNGTNGTLVSLGFKSTALTTDNLEGAWIFVPSATVPRQRRIATNGINISTGTITFDDVMGSATTGSVEFEVSPHLALAWDNGVATGPGQAIEECVTEALAHLVSPDRISVPITTGYEISLATWANWLNQEKRLVRVLEPGPDSTRPPTDASWRFRRGEPMLTLDGEAPKLLLRTPFLASGGNLTLEVLRPADTWLRISGTWQEVAPGVGMTAETDACLPDLRHIREAGLVFAYRTLASIHTGTRRAEYQAKYERQLAVARALPYWDATRDDLPAAADLVAA